MLILFSQIQYPFYNSTNMVGGVYKGVSFILLIRDNCDGSELQVAQNSFVWAGDTKLVELYLYRQWGTTVQKKCLRTQSYGPSAGIECRKCAVRHVCKTPTWSISSQLSTSPFCASTSPALMLLSSAASWQPAALRIPWQPFQHHESPGTADCIGLCCMTAAWQKAATVLQFAKSVIQTFHLSLGESGAFLFF